MIHKPQARSVRRASPTSAIKTALPQTKHPTLRSFFWTKTMQTWRTEATNLLQHSGLKSKDWFYLFGRNLYLILDITATLTKWPGKAFTTPTLIHTVISFLKVIILLESHIILCSGVSKATKQSDKTVPPQQPAMFSYCYRWIRCVPASRNVSTVS